MVRIHVGEPNLRLRTEANWLSLLDLRSIPKRPFPAQPNRNILFPSIILLSSKREENA